jgi:hypothetical protein
VRCDRAALECSPGAAGVTFKAFRAGPDLYQGWFLSSDDQLNRM